MKPADHEQKDAFYNRSLERALQVLIAFNEERNTLGVAQLSEILNLPRVTVSRLCSTLMKYGFLRQDPDSRHYSLGSRLFELGSIFFNSFSVRKVAAPYLTQLEMKLRKTIFLGVLENDELLYLDKREDPGNPISFTSKVGSSRPPYWGMCGPMLMAYLPEDEIDRLLEKSPLAAGTRKSITNDRQFKDWLRSIQEQGFALDAETTFEGITGVAAPIRDFTGKVVASLGVALISSSADPKDLKQIVKETTKTALAISRGMGYAGKRESRQ
jgi:IclR family transcriptional regulator, KDG regulon repressor